MFVSSLPTVAGRLLAVGDPDATRTVYTIVVVLLVIGVVLIGVGIWVIRQTKSDPELLAPLEQMDTRAWRKRDPAGRQRMLDDVRPEGAVPVHSAQEEPDVDDDFDLAEKRVPTFADLEGVASAAASDGEVVEDAPDSDGAVEDEPAMADDEAVEVDAIDDDGASAEPSDDDGGEVDGSVDDGVPAVAVDVVDALDDGVAAVVVDAEAVESDR